MSPEERAREIRRKVAEVQQRDQGQTLGAFWHTLDALIVEAVTAAAAEERERCAQIADRRAGPFGGVGLIVAAAEIAAEIRRGDQHG